MVALFIGACGLLLFFSGVIALLSDPQDKKRQRFYFLVFVGIVLLGGAASVSYRERVYYLKRLDAWSSLDVVAKMPPVEIQGKWYKIVLEEVEPPEGK